MIIVGPMLGTNVLSTALIAWKAWRVAWVLVSSAVMTDKPTPSFLPFTGSTAEPWVHNSEGVALLNAWRKFSGF
jgi:hypothetical protein